MWQFRGDLRQSSEGDTGTFGFRRVIFFRRRRAGLLLGLDGLVEEVGEFLRGGPVRIEQVDQG
ncbi:hypothetical protein AR457_35530 [Streptomyces agglomeratus]|nr:hypothetical protein AR457_35530 [Streptomyces agglomeratus]